MRKIPLILFTVFLCAFFKTYAEDQQTVTIHMMSSEPEYQEIHEIIRQLLNVVNKFV